MNSRLSSVEPALPALSPRSLVAEARHTRTHGLAHGLLTAVRTVRDVLATFRQRRETIAQLRALSDRELADIGLNRGAIPAVAAANDAGHVRRAA
jgi:uncharacterized protein YjiS (DUF1127 family)